MSEQTPVDNTPASISAPKSSPQRENDKLRDFREAPTPRGGWLPLPSIPDMNSSPDHVEKYNKAIKQRLDAQTRQLNMHRERQRAENEENKRLFREGQELKAKWKAHQAKKEMKAQEAREKRLANEAEMNQGAEALMSIYRSDSSPVRDEEVMPVPVVNNTFSTERDKTEQTSLPPASSSLPSFQVSAQSPSRPPQAGITQSSPATSVPPPSQSFPASPLSGLQILSLAASMVTDSNTTPASPSPSHRILPYPRKLPVSDERSALPSAPPAGKVQEVDGDETEDENDVKL